MSAIIFLAAALAGEPPAGFRSLFNGKDLNGWSGRTDVWKVENGAIVADTPGLKQNEFLTTAKRYRNFVLQASFRLVGGKGNSGIQIRSDRIPNDSEMIGYQADVGDGYWGALYDESRRNRVLSAPKGDASERLDKALKKEGWNRYLIRAAGTRIQLWINGAMTVDYTEKEDKIAPEGLIGLQVHSDRNPVRVEFKDVFIQELPAVRSAEEAKTGFLFHAFSHAGTTVGYTVYVPEKYSADSTTQWPAILFLHGSGERGVDGRTQSAVGLGPAIAARADFPFIAVIPQARQTWKAGSKDSEAALGALADAQKRYRVDPDRIHLTGLSMGGHGTWELATAKPELWASATVVCGFGDAAAASKIGKLPIRMYCGDKDMPRIVESMKAISTALEAKGGDFKMTWYPGVGHNSWDAAYNDDELYRWMAQQRRPAH
jgi:dienelactone hydrolase